LRGGSWVAEKRGGQASAKRWEPAPLLRCSNSKGVKHLTTESEAKHTVSGGDALTLQTLTGGTIHEEALYTLGYQLEV